MEGLKKIPTGIIGLDKVLHGGLPQGRPTLVCGGPGCGKTMLSMEFVCHGSQQFAEPGLYLSFDETKEDIRTNFSPCGFWPVEGSGKETISIESIPIVNTTYEIEAGEFTLDGLLVRLEHLCDAIGARRLVLDSLDALFSRFSDTNNLRLEITRIFQWIKERGLSAIVTSESGEGTLTRHGLEAYISDCVIHMDHRVSEQISKRRIRIVKYRGSSHGMDEYPFLITGEGLSVLAISSTDLDSTAPNEFVSTGIAGLDDMIGGKGSYRGSTILVTGGAGTGKSTIGVCFARSTCQNGGRSLLLAYEESDSQILRNMRSIGIDLEPYSKNGLLRIEPMRPSTFGLEEHLVRMNRLVREFQPDTVVMDPITSFTTIGDKAEVRSMLFRMVNFLKNRQINALMTNLTPGSGTDEETEAAVSSLVDTWIVLRFQRSHATRRRQIYVHKARGIGHSHDIRELIMSPSGLTVQPFADVSDVARGEK